MKDEYDFRGAERGKFYRPGAQIHYRDHEGRIVHRGHPVTEPCSIPGCDGGCPSVGCDAKLDASQANSSRGAMTLFEALHSGRWFRRRSWDRAVDPFALRLFREPLGEPRKRLLSSTLADPRPSAEELERAPLGLLFRVEYSEYRLSSSDVLAADWEFADVEGARVGRTVVGDASVSEADRAVATAGQDTRDVQGDWRTRARATPMSLPLRRLRAFARDGYEYDPPIHVSLLGRLREDVGDGLDAYGQGIPGDLKTRVSLESLVVTWHRDGSSIGALGGLGGLARDVAVLLASLECNAQRVQEDWRVRAGATPMSLPLRRLRAFARDGDGYDPRGPVVAELLAHLRDDVGAGLRAYGDGGPGERKAQEDLERFVIAWHRHDGPAGVLARDVAVLLLALEHNLAKDASARS